MKRIAANYLYINAETTLRNGVVELDDKGVVQNFFSLDNLPAETSQTEFFNGTLMPKDKEEVRIGEKMEFYLIEYEYT
ncbi:MAG: hypothetical protein LBN27_01275 [Prevotellaceae bacterium]|jgi:hypothetical protein|nr:hypothetical protein [Prevotellaceae bacterium]